jgi:hypothetical protein
MSMKQFRIITGGGLQSSGNENTQADPTYATQKVPLGCHQVCQNMRELPDGRSTRDVYGPLFLYEGNS